MVVFLLLGLFTVGTLYIMALTVPLQKLITLTGLKDVKVVQFWKRINGDTDVEY